MSWLSFLFEAGMASLMVVLIFYCVKLNRRLTQIRSHDTEINELIAGLRDASERADVSVQRLKAAGLSAERSVRAAIEDASVAQTEMSEAAATKSWSPQPEPENHAVSSDPAVEIARAAGNANALHSRSSRPERDMLMASGEAASGPPKPAKDTEERSQTREEAEEAVLQAIRTARAGT